MIGTDTQILIERPGKLRGQMIGRSPWLQSVHVDTDAKPGDILDVSVAAASSNSLSGVIRQKVAA